MGKKYLDTKKGSLEENISLLEYYDPQYEGMTVAEVAALDEDALGVDIARGLMKVGKKGGFKIGGKAWNSSAMLGIRKKIGTAASKARATKTDLEKQKNKTKAQAAANSDKSELDARKQAKKDGVPDESKDDDGNIKQDEKGNTLYKTKDGGETSDPEEASKRKASPQEIDQAGSAGRKAHDDKAKPSKPKGKKDKEKEPTNPDAGSDDTADTATSTDAEDPTSSSQSSEIGDKEGGTAHTSGGQAAALGDKEKENPLAGDGDKEKTATPEPEKSGSEKPKGPEKTGDKQPEKPKGPKGGDRRSKDFQAKNPPDPSKKPKGKPKPKPTKPKTEGVLKMTSQTMPDMREALKQVRETETKTHIVEVNEIGTDEYREYTEKVTPGQKTEKLTAKQKKIDVDGDGEIEGSDLAKLRKKKTESQKTSVREMWAQAYKDVQEHKGNKPHKHPHVDEDEEVEEGTLPPALQKAIDAKKGKDDDDEKKDKKENKKLTMTGKKKEPVEINPNIKMEKKKQKNW